MATTQVTLPNGCRLPDGRAVRTAEFRHLDGDDEDFIRDKEQARQDNLLDRLIRRCLVRLGDDTEPADIARAWSHLHLADTQALLIDLRRASIGSRYTFDRQCPRCGKVSPQSLDLGTLKLDVQAEEDFGHDVYDAKVVTERPEDGETLVSFVPLRTTHAALLESIKTQYPHERSTREMLVQLRTVNGETADAPSLKKLPWAVRQGIRDAMDAVEGGYDTELQITCPHCEAVEKAQMPINMQSFFFPRAGTSWTSSVTPCRPSGTTPSTSPSSSTGPRPTSVG
jgi:hypothetical protein